MRQLPASGEAATSLTMLPGGVHAAGDGAPDLVSHFAPHVRGGNSGGVVAFVESARVAVAPEACATLHMLPPLAAHNMGSPLVVRGGGPSGAQTPGDPAAAAAACPAPLEHAPYDVAPSFVVGLHAAPPPGFAPVPTAAPAVSALPGVVALSVRPHTAFLKQEGNWLARDFYQERRWKVAASGRVGGLVAARARWLELRKKREERKLLASPVAAAVQSLWLGALSQVDASVIPPSLQPCCGALPPTGGNLELRASLLGRRHRFASSASSFRPSVGSSSAQPGDAQPGDAEPEAAVDSGVSSSVNLKATLLREQVRNNADALFAPHVRGKIGSLFFFRDSPFSVFADEEATLFLASLAALRPGGPPGPADERRREKREEDLKAKKDDDGKPAAGRRKSVPVEADGGRRGEEAEDLRDEEVSGRVGRRDRAEDGEREGGEGGRQDPKREERPGKHAETDDRTDDEDSPLVSPQSARLDTAGDDSARPSSRAHRRRSAADDAVPASSDQFIPVSVPLHVFLLDTVARSLENHRVPLSGARRRASGDADRGDSSLLGPSLFASCRSPAAVVLPSSSRDGCDARCANGSEKKHPEKREEESTLCGRDMGLPAGVSEASPSAGSISATSRGEVDSPVHSVSTTWSSSLPLASSSKAASDGSPAPASGASPAERDKTGARPNGERPDEDTPGGASGPRGSTWGVQGACACCFCREGGAGRASDKLPSASPGPDEAGGASAAEPATGASESEEGEQQHCRCQACFLSEGVLSKREFLAGSPQLGAADHLRQYVGSSSSPVIQDLSFSSRFFPGARGGLFFAGGDRDAGLLGAELAESDFVSISDWLYLTHEKTLDLAAPLTFDILANAPPGLFLGAAVAGLSEKATPSPLSRRSREDKGAGAYGSARAKGHGRGSSRFGSLHVPPVSPPAHRDPTAASLGDGAPDAGGSGPGREAATVGEDDVKDEKGRGGGAAALAVGGRGDPLDNAERRGGGDECARDGRDLAASAESGAGREREEEGEEDDDDERLAAAGAALAAAAGAAAALDAHRAEGPGDGAAGAAASGLCRQKSRLARKERKRKAAWKLLENVSLAAIWDILNKKAETGLGTDLLPVEFRAPDWRLDVCQVPALKAGKDDWSDAVEQLSGLAAGASSSLDSPSSSFSHLPGFVSSSLFEGAAFAAFAAMGGLSPMVSATQLGAGGDPSPSMFTRPYPFSSELMFGASPQGAAAGDRRRAGAFPDYLGHLSSFGPLSSSFGPDGFAIAGGALSPPAMEPSEPERGDKENREHDDGRKDPRDDATHVAPLGGGVYFHGAAGADRGHRPGELGARGSPDGRLEHGLPGSYPFLVSSQASASPYVQRHPPGRGLKGPEDLRGAAFSSAYLGKGPYAPSPYAPGAPYGAFPPGAGRPPIGPAVAGAAGLHPPPAGAGGAGVGPRGPHLGPPLGAQAGGHKGQPAGAGAARTRDEYGAQRGTGLVSAGGVPSLGAGRSGGGRYLPQWDLNESAILLSLVKKFGQPNSYLSLGVTPKPRACGQSGTRSEDARRRGLPVVAGLRRRLLLHRKLWQREQGEGEEKRVREAGAKASLSVWPKKRRLHALLASLDGEERSAGAPGKGQGEEFKGQNAPGVSSAGGAGASEAKKTGDREADEGKTAFPSVLTYSSRSVNWGLVATTLSHSGTWLSNALAGSEAGRRQSSFSPQGISLVSIGDAMASSAVSRLRSPAECREQYLLLRAHLRHMLGQPKSQRHPMLVLLLQQYHKHVRRHPTFQENFYPFSKQTPGGSKNLSQTMPPCPPLFSHSVRESLAPTSFAPLLESASASAVVGSCASARGVLRGEGLSGSLGVQPPLPRSAEEMEPARKRLQEEACEGEGRSLREKKRVFAAVDGEQESLLTHAQRAVVVLEARDRGDEHGGADGDVCTERGRKRKESRDDALTAKRRRLEGEGEQGGSEDARAVVFSVYPLAGSFLQDLTLWSSMLLRSDERSPAARQPRRRLGGASGPLERFLRVMARRRREGLARGGDAYPRRGPYGLSGTLVHLLAPLLLSLPSSAFAADAQRPAVESKEGRDAWDLAQETDSATFEETNADSLPRRLELVLVAASQLSPGSVCAPGSRNEAAVRDRLRALLGSLLVGVPSARDRRWATPRVVPASVGTVWAGDVPGAQVVWDACGELVKSAYSLSRPGALPPLEARFHLGYLAPRWLPLPSPAISANRAFFSSVSTQLSSSKTARPRGDAGPKPSRPAAGTASAGPGKEGQATTAARPPGAEGEALKESDLTRESEQPMDAAGEALSAAKTSGSAPEEDKKGGTCRRAGDDDSLSSFVASSAKKEGFWLLLGPVGENSPGEGAQAAAGRQVPAAWRTSRYGSGGGAVGFGAEGPSFHELIRCVTRKSLSALACSVSHLCRRGRLAARSASSSAARAHLRASAVSSGRGPSGPSDASGPVGTAAAQRQVAGGGPQDAAAGAEGDNCSFSSGAGAGRGERQGADAARQRRAAGASSSDVGLPGEISQQEAEGIKLAAALVCRCSDSMRKRLAALNSLSDALGVRSLLPPGVPANSLLVPPHPSQLRFLDGASHLLSSYVQRQEAPSLLYSPSSPRASSSGDAGGDASAAKSAKGPESGSSGRLSLGVLPLCGPLAPQQFGPGVMPWLLIANLALQREEQEQLLVCATNWLHQSASSRTSASLQPFPNPTLAVAGAGPAIVTPAVASLEAFRKPQLPEVLALFRAQQTAHRASGLHARNPHEAALSSRQQSSSASHYVITRTGPSSVSASGALSSSSLASASSAYLSSHSAHGTPPPRVVVSPSPMPPPAQGGSLPPAAAGALPGPAGAAPPSSPGRGPQDGKGGPRRLPGREGEMPVAYSRGHLPKERQPGSSGPDAGMPPGYLYPHGGVPPAGAASHAPGAPFPGQGGGAPGAQPYAPPPGSGTFQRPVEKTCDAKGVNADPRARLAAAAGPGGPLAAGQAGDAACQLGMQLGAAGGGAGQGAKPGAQDPSFHASAGSSAPLAYPHSLASPPGGGATAPSFQGGARASPPPSATEGDRPSSAARDVAFAAHVAASEQGGGSGSAARPGEGEAAASGAGQSGRETSSSSGAPHVQTGGDAVAASFRGEASSSHAGSAAYGAQRHDGVTAAGRAPAGDTKGSEPQRGPSSQTGGAADGSEVASAPQYRAEEGVNSGYASGAPHAQNPNMFAAPAGGPRGRAESAHSGAGAYAPSGGPGGVRALPYGASAPDAPAFSPPSGAFPHQSPAGGAMAAGPYGARQQSPAGEAAAFSQGPRPAGDAVAGVREGDADSLTSALPPATAQGGVLSQRQSPAAAGSGGVKEEPGAGVGSPLKSVKSGPDSAPGYYYAPPAGAEAPSGPGGGPEAPRADGPGSRGLAGAGERRDMGQSADGAPHHNYGAQGSEFMYDAQQQAANSGFRMPSASPSQQVFYNPTTFPPPYLVPGPHGSSDAPASQAPGDCPPTTGASPQHPGQTGPVSGPAGGSFSGAGVPNRGGAPPYFGAVAGQPNGGREEEQRRMSMGGQGVSGASPLPQEGGYGYPLPGNPVIRGKEEGHSQLNYALPPSALGSTANPARPPGVGEDGGPRREGSQSPCPPGWGGVPPGTAYAASSVSSASPLSSSPPSSVGSKQRRSPAAAGAQAGAPKAQSARKRQKKQAGDKGNADPSMAKPKGVTPPSMMKEEDEDRVAMGAGAGGPKKEKAEGSALVHHGRGLQGPGMVSPASPHMPGAPPHHGVENMSGNPGMMRGNAPAPFGGPQQLMPGGLETPDANGGGAAAGFVVQHPSPYLFSHSHPSSVSSHSEGGAPPPQMTGAGAPPPGVGAGREAPSGQEGVSSQSSFSSSSAPYHGGMPLSMYGGMPGGVPGARSEGLPPPGPHQPRGPGGVGGMPGQGPPPHGALPAQPGGRGMPDGPFASVGKPGVHGGFASSAGAANHSANSAGDAGGVPAGAARNGDFGDGARGPPGVQHPSPCVQQQQGSAPPHPSSLYPPSSYPVSGHAPSFMPPQAPAGALGHGAPPPAEGSHAMGAGMHGLASSQSGSGFVPFAPGGSLPGGAPAKPVNQQLPPASFAPASAAGSFPPQVHGSPPPGAPFMNAPAHPADPGASGGRGEPGGGPGFFNGGGERGHVQSGDPHGVSQSFFHSHPQNPYDAVHGGALNAGAPALGHMNAQMPQFSSSHPMNPYGPSSLGGGKEGHSGYSPSLQMNPREGSPGAAGAGGVPGVSPAFAQAPGSYVMQEGGVDARQGRAPPMPQPAFAPYQAQRAPGREGEASSSYPGMAPVPQQPYYAPPPQGQFPEGGQ